MRLQSRQRAIYNPAWVAEDGPSDDVAISTRARLARNIKGIKFPTKATEAELKRVADLVLDTIYSSQNELGNLRTVYPSRLSESEKLALVNSRLASRLQVNGGRYQPIVLNENGSLSVMINEEDHIRIQCILPGFQPTAALDLAQQFDSLINGKIDYAVSDDYGYLTSSLANAGTGLRLSVMLHLAGLTYLDEALEVLTAAARLRISIRGLFGEGTKAYGDIFQVSNETAIGINAREITARVRAAAEHFITRERKAREKLIAEKMDEISDSVDTARAYLTESTALKGTDALEYLSMLRLGGSIGLIKGISQKLFKELLISMQLGTSALGGTALRGDTLNSDLKRAKLVRSGLLEV